MLSFLRSTESSSTHTHDTNRALVITHPFFAGAAHRLFATEAAAAILPRIAAVYAQRSYELWGGNPPAMQLLFDTAREVLTEVEQGSWVRCFCPRMLLGPSGGG